MLKKDIVGAILLVFLASIKVVADIFGWGHVSALAAATNASPAMKVFTAHKGYETYSSTYILSVDYGDGSDQTLILDPEVYSQLKGPYNRRNVYGAAIAYGPILTTNDATIDTWNSIVTNTFCLQKSSAAFELGFDKNKDIEKITVSYKNTKDPQGFPEEITLNCNEK